MARFNPRPGVGANLIGPRARASIEKAAIALVARNPRYADARYRRLQMHIDLRRLPAGMPLGPQFRDERARRLVEYPGSVLVFVDPEPLANFGHDCLYWLFAPGTEVQPLGRLVQEVRARFPPFLEHIPASYGLFTSMQESLPLAMRGWSPPIRPSGWEPDPLLPGGNGVLTPQPIGGGVTPAIAPVRRKHAILYAGNPEPCHVNDLEFCYRILRDQLGFQQQDIHVLNFKGKLTTAEWGEGPPPGPWPGFTPANGIPGYWLRSHQPIRSAARSQMKQVLQLINGNLGQNDLLFIFTTAHGDSLGGNSFITTYEPSVRYWASEFGSDLGILAGGGKQLAQLVVMMQQCGSGGFMNVITSSACAADISFASAATQNGISYKRKGLVWDDFSYNWLAALKGGFPGGTVLGVSVDGMDPAQPPDQVVSAREVFYFAKTRAYSLDSPQYRSGPPWNAVMSALQAGTWNGADQISLA